MRDRLKNEFADNLDAIKIIDDVDGASKSSKIWLIVGLSVGSVALLGVIIVLVACCRGWWCFRKKELVSGNKMHVGYGSVRPTTMTEAAELYAASQNTNSKRDVVESVYIMNSV